MKCGLDKETIHHGQSLNIKMRDCLAVFVAEAVFKIHLKLVQRSRGADFAEEAGNHFVVDVVVVVGVFHQRLFVSLQPPIALKLQALYGVNRI